MIVLLKLLLFLLLLQQASFFAVAVDAVVVSPVVAAVDRANAINFAVAVVVFAAVAVAAVFARCCI